MSIKRCAYKNCLSSSEDKSNTFFQFPKDQQRYDMWMKLSATENKTGVTKYLCAKHFDHSKYVANNPRRKLLLAQAVPYAYEENSEVYKKEEDEISESNYNNDEIENILMVNDEYSAKRTKISEDDEFLYDEDGTQVCIETTDANSQENSVYYLNSIVYNSNEKKTERATYSSEHRKPCPKTKSQSTKDYVSENHEEVESIDDVSNLVEELAEDELVSDNPNITTFIFKDQEYIQMPKADYISEKMELVKKLKLYQTALKKIKKNIDVLRI